MRITNKNLHTILIKVITIKKELFQGKIIIFNGANNKMPSVILSIKIFLTSTMWWILIISWEYEWDINTKAF